MSVEYYFFIASKIGADSRVMGIATAVETAPGMGRFFCLHRTIYTLGVCLIKATAAGCGQLLICTRRPCFGRPRPGWLAIDQPLAGRMKISWIVLLLSVLMASCGGGRVYLLNAKLAWRVPRRRLNEWPATTLRRSGLIRKGNEHR